MKTPKIKSRPIINVTPGPSGYWYRVLSNGKAIKTGYDVGDYPSEDHAKAVIGGYYRAFLAEQAEAAAAE